MIDQSASRGARDPYEDAIDIADWLLAVQRSWRSIAGAAVLGMVVAGAVVWLSPINYSASRILATLTEYNPESTPAAVRSYQAVLNDPRVSQQVVASLALSRPPVAMSVMQFRERALTVSTDLAGRIVVSVKLADPGLAVQAVDGLVANAEKLWLQRDERSRVEERIALVLRLKVDLAAMFSDVQAEQARLTAIQSDRATGQVARSELEREGVTTAVRLAQLRSRRDYVAAGLRRAANVQEMLRRLPPTEPIPESIKNEMEALDESFGVSAGAPQASQVPLQPVAETTISEPPGKRRWLGPLALGFTIGFILAVIGTIGLSIRTRARTTPLTAE